MTVKTSLFGGTDWSDGDILYATDLNDTFDASGRIKLNVDLSSGGGTYNSTWTDVETLDLSSYNVVAIEVFTIPQVSGEGSGGGTAYFEIVITLSDDSTYTLLSTNKNITATTYRTNYLKSYNAPSGKTIKTVTFKVKSDGSKWAGYTPLSSGWNGEWDDSLQYMHPYVKYLYY